MAAPTEVDSAVSNPGGTGSTLTAILPSTQAVGDVLYIWVTNSGNVLWAGNPAGWSRKDQRTVGTSANGLVGTLLFRKLVSGDSLPLTNPVCTLGATVTREAVAWTERGADVEGVHVLSEWSGNGHGTGTANPVRPPTVITPAPDMHVIHCYGQRSATNAPEPTGYTQMTNGAVIISGTLVTNVSSKTVANQQTSLANQDASPTSGARWVACVLCIPSPDYPYHRSMASATVANGTTVTPALPTGTTASDVNARKDLIIATVEAAGNAIAIAPNTPADWTEITGFSDNTSGNGTTVRKYWALYDGSLDRAFTRPTNGELSAYLNTYHNCHQTVPIGAVNKRQNASSTTSTWDALTRINTKVAMNVTCVADGVPTFTSPAGWTERMDGLGMTCADQPFNATGSTASASFTLSTASPTLVGLIEIVGAASVGPTTLVIANASHDHTVQSLTLTQVHLLAVQNATHSQTANNLTLTQVHSLTIQNSSHAHTAGNVVLTQVRRVVLAASANITASGEATTAQLTPPSGKTTADFTAGRMQDDENPTDTVNLGVDDYTELEWSVQLSSFATGDFEFRVTANGTPLDTYSVTPQLSVGAAPTNLVIQSASHAHTAENAVFTQVHSLVVADASHAHTANNLALTQVHSLAVQNSSNTHTAENLSLTQTHALTVQNSSHSHTAESLTLTQVHSLAIANSSHSHAADNLALTQVHQLDIASASHSHTAQNLALTQVHSLTVQGATHTHTAENLVLGGAGDLAVQNASHGHTVQSLVLTQVHQLAIQNSSHAHTAQTVAITSSSDLVVQSASHGHSANNLTLTQVHSITVQSATHSHSAENLVLAGEGTLGIQNATHTHTAQNLVLTQVHELAIANSTHGQTADNLTLTQVHSLTIQNASHGHTAENLTLAAEGTLGIHNGAHAHTAQNVVLTQVHTLAIQDASHGHTSGSPTLTEVYNLTVQSATHTQTAGNLVLTQVHSLIVSNATHSHTAQSFILGGAGNLLIDNAVHGHTARNISFAFNLPRDIYTTVGENRIFDVPDENRILAMPSEDRILDA